jgi:hypothetical protein
MPSILLNPNASKMEYFAKFHASSDEVPHCSRAIPLPKCTNSHTFAHRSFNCGVHSPDFRLPITTTPLKASAGTAIAQGASNNPPQIGSVERAILEHHSIAGGNNERATVDHLFEQVCVLAASKIEAGRERGMLIRQRVSTNKGVTCTCGVPRHNSTISAEEIVESTAGSKYTRAHPPRISVQRARSPRLRLTYSLFV